MEDYPSRRVIALCRMGPVGLNEWMCCPTLLLDRHEPLERGAPGLHILWLVYIPEDSAREQNQALSSSIGA